MAKYAYSNSNIWSNVPIFTSLKCYYSHPQASGSLPAFWHKFVSPTYSTCSLWGSRQEFGKAKISILAWFSIPCLFGIKNSTPNCTQDPIFWLMILGFPEEFENNHFYTVRKCLDQISDYSLFNVCFKSHRRLNRSDVIWHNRVVPVFRGDSRGGPTGASAPITLSVDPSVAPLTVSLH